MFYNENMKKQRWVFVLILFSFMAAVSVATMIIISGMTKDQNNVDDIEIETTQEEEQPTAEEIEERKQVDIRAYNDELQRDLNEMVSTLKQFQKRNNGRIPVDFNIFYDVYLDSEIVAKYDFSLCSMSEGTCPDTSKFSWDKNKRIIFVMKNSVCKNGNVVRISSRTKVAFLSTKQTDDGSFGGNLCQSN